MRGFSQENVNLLVKPSLFEEHYFEIILTVAS